MPICCSINIVVAQYVEAFLKSAKVVTIVVNTIIQRYITWSIKLLSCLAALVSNAVFQVNSIL